MKAQHQPLENGQVKLSSAGQFASLFLLAVQFDNYPGPGKKVKASLAAPGSYPSLFSRVLPLWILLSCACLFCPVTFCQQFLFHLWFLSHKHLVSFINSHLASTFLFFPAPLIKDFPSFVFSLPPLLSCSLPLSLPHCPPTLAPPHPSSLSLSATVFTWPLHVTWSWAKTPRMPASALRCSRPC